MPNYETNPFSIYYLDLPSPFGGFTVVWAEAGPTPRVLRIVLAPPPSPGGVPPTALALAKATYPDARPGATPEIAALGDQLQRVQQGEPIAFDLDLIALDRCGDFQRQVLLAEYAIPRGSVSTYGRIAAHIGHPGAAHAVGSALARNPFPLAIPCHRAIRADRALGGYQGGPAMKRALLGFEGVLVTEDARVPDAPMVY